MIILKIKGGRMSKKTEVNNGVKPISVPKPSSNVGTNKK